MPRQPAPDANRRAELVNRAQAGCTDAFALLYDEYVAIVHRFIYARVRSTTLAEDLTSETFLRALRRLDSFHWDRDFGAWLITIARNLIIDHYKTKRVRCETLTDDIGTYRSPAQATPETDMLATLTADELRNAIAELPDNQRDCLVMRFFADLSIAETAHALGKTEGAIKQLQLRAIRRLSQIISEDLS